MKRPGGWWWRVLVWSWINRWRNRPLRRTPVALMWPAAVLVLPLLLDLTGLADAAVAWLLSLDVPLALLLALQSALASIAVASQPDSERWIAPAGRRGAGGRLLWCARFLHAVRWPLGLALATLLLKPASRDDAGHIVELLVLAAVSLTCGAMLAWLLLNREQTSVKPGPAAVSTLPVSWALSLAPLRETQRILDMRRIALLAVPLLLAAPMGTPAQQVLRALAIWVPLLFIASWFGQAVRIVRALRAWLPRRPHQSLRLYWQVGRVVVMAALVGGLALWFGWRATAQSGGTSPP